MDIPFELAVDPDKAHHAHVSFDLGPLPVVFHDSELSRTSLLTTEGVLAFEFCPVILVSLFDGGAYVRSGFSDHTTIPYAGEALLFFEDGDQANTISEAMEHPGVLERIEELQRLGDPVAFMDRQQAELDAFIDSMPEEFGSDEAYYDWCEEQGLEPRGLHTIDAREARSIHQLQDSRRMASYEGARRRSNEVYFLDLRASHQARTDALLPHGARYELGSDETFVTLHGTGERPWVLFQEVHFAEGMYRVVSSRPLTITAQDINTFGGSFVGHEGEPGYVVMFKRLNAS